MNVAIGDEKKFLEFNKRWYFI